MESAVLDKEKKVIKDLNSHYLIIENTKSTDLIKK
jgi:hypothetical protein